MTRAPLACLLGILSTLLTGCIIGYSGFPIDKLGPEKRTSQSGVLSYRIPKPEFHIIREFPNPEPAYGRRAYKRLKAYFDSETPFAASEEVGAPPDHGLFVDIRTEILPVSVSTQVYATMSMATFWLLPFWSREAGYIIWMDVYRDGNKENTFQYKVHRDVFVWLLAFPISWVNFATYDETQVVEAIANKFFEEAAPVMELKR